MRDEADRKSAAARERQVIVFGLAIILTYLIAAVLPDLIPAAARQNLAVYAHARVVSVDQPNPTSQPNPSDQPIPTDSGAPGGTAGPGASPDNGSGGPPVLVQATVLFIDGPLAGQQGQGIVQGPSGSLQLPDYRPGDEVVVEIDTAPDGTQSMALVDRWRLPLFGALCGLITVLAAAVAGWRGLRAMASLALTLVLTVRVFVPLVILGWSPVGLAIVFGIVVTILSFMLTQGFSRTTLSAIAGTTIGLALTGILAVIVTGAAQFTQAQGSEEIIFLGQMTNGTVDLSGILLAAVIFGGLGILNDVAISQAATVEELHDADPSMSRRELFLRTMNVGTAHLAATINTLVFAYLGTALPLVVLLALQASNGGAAISLESVAVEVTRTLVGAIGILAAVPATTAIAVRWVVQVPAQPRPGTSSVGDASGS